jgi:uncharacterized membrane protein
VIGSGRTGPWILRNGHVSNLPGVANGFAYGINSTGAVAGTQVLGQSSLPMSRPVVWRSPGAKPIDLPIPPGAISGDAFDIDDDGSVVGSYMMDASGQTSHAIVWFPNGTERELLVPAGSGLISPFAVSIRNGWVAGGADIPAVGSQKPPMLVGMLWNLRTGEIRVLPPVAPARVNRQGWVVGASQYGMLVTDAGTLRLPELVGADIALPTTVSGISDDGRTLVGESNSKPALWQCH